MHKLNALRIIALSTLGIPNIISSVHVIYSPKCKSVAKTFAPKHIHKDNVQLYQPGHMLDIDLFLPFAII